MDFSSLKALYVPYALTGDWPIMERHGNPSMFPKMLKISDLGSLVAHSVAFIALEERPLELGNSILWPSRVDSLQGSTRACHVDSE
jgi:hypothetical protein